MEEIAPEAGQDNWLVDRSGGRQEDLPFKGDPPLGHNRGQLRLHDPTAMKD